MESRKSEISVDAFRICVDCLLISFFCIVKAKLDCEKVGFEQPVLNRLFSGLLSFGLCLVSFGFFLFGGFRELP